MNPAHMLTRTFCHIPKIGRITERKIWKSGYMTWDEALAGAKAAFGRKSEWARAHLEQSTERLAAGDAAWFDEHLPSAERWRLFNAFRDKTAYVDIETTGLTEGLDHVTSVALYDGRSVRTYVWGRNLEDFIADVLGFSLLVTFNGACFDVPILERHFGERIVGPGRLGHIDLRFACRKIGLRGGLKSIEHQIGLSRGDLDGVDGWFAVLLWNEYLNTGDSAALETLLAYNAADAANLELLLVHVFNALLEETPFHMPLCLVEPQPAVLPFAADTALVARLRAKYGLYGGY
jgi:uncharacterized protein YprB with RNaseH-like and TPR domain